MKRFGIIVVLCLFGSVFMVGSSFDLKYQPHSYIDADTTVTYLKAHQILKFVKDSVENSIKRNQCPLILYDPCMDYQRQFRSYLQFSIHPKTGHRAIIPCSHCKSFSIKEDVIDSLSIDQVRRICELCDTVKLNQKCHDSIYLGGMPRLNYKQSSYDLILTRLKNQ